MGVWIEIHTQRITQWIIRVHPLVGVWIEIPSLMKYGSQQSSVHPLVGVWIEILIQKAVRADYDTNCLIFYAIMNSVIFPYAIFRPGQNKSCICFFRCFWSGKVLCPRCRKYL